jgi:hypothetical protein
MSVSGDELSQHIRAADWTDVVERLLLIARTALGAHAPADRRRFEKVCSAYVERTVARLLAEGAARARRFRMHSLLQLLGAMLLSLVEKDDREVTRIVTTANWDDVSRRVLAYTAAKHGSDATRSGKTPADRLNHAVMILLERRHHFPHYRNVSLVAFLCSTIDGIVSHDAEKVRKRGTPLRIVTERIEGVGECSEEELPAVVEEPRDVIAEKQSERFIAALEPQLQAYVRLRQAEPGWTTKQYAEMLGTSVEQIRNWDRKLRRRRKKSDH